jgi:hypothetical protein
MDTSPSKGVSSKEIVTVAELAELLRLPKSWIYGRTRTAGITGFPVLRCGRYCRFEINAVLEWLRVQNVDERKNATISLK